MTLGQCPRCVLCHAPDCGRIAWCAGHPSDPLCAHDWRGCDEHPCTDCAEADPWDDDAYQRLWADVFARRP